MANSIDPSVLDPRMECWKAVDPEISSHIDFHKRLFMVFLCSSFRWRARMKKKCYPHELMKRTAQLWVHEHSWHLQPECQPQLWWPAELASGQHQSLGVKLDAAKAVKVLSHVQKHNKQRIGTYLLNDGSAAVGS